MKIIKKIIILELQSEENHKKAKIVGKIDNNNEHAAKEKTENKSITLDKDENIENTKSEGEAKGEDEEYGKLTQQWQNHQK